MARKPPSISESRTRAANRGEAQVDVMIAEVADDAIRALAAVGSVG
jgi:hypothetical protein